MEKNKSGPIIIDEAFDGEIIYKFKRGNVANKKFSTIDMGGTKREFIITINDEKGITSCYL